MSGDGRPIATPSQTIGPFFHFALATNAALGQIAAAEEAGQRIRLRVRVLDGDGMPVPDALIEVYHADAEGRYPQPSSHERTFTGFGRLATDADGICEFETVRPGPVAASRHVEAPHVIVCLLARGLLRHLYTRIYFIGDAGHDVDPILQNVPADRRGTLIASLAGEGVWDFVIRLQGVGETVFFDF